MKKMDIDDYLLEEFSKFTRDYKDLESEIGDEIEHPQVARFLKFASKMMLDDIINVSEELQEKIVDDDDFSQEDLLKLKRINHQLRSLHEELEDKLSGGEL